MNSAWNIGKFSQGRLVRAIALLFLFHSGADLVFPQLCSEEPFGISMNQTFIATDEANDYYQSIAASLPASNESDQKPRREDRSRDEDCFCCCTHVMPGPLFVEPRVADAHLGKSFQPDVSITSAQLKPPDHPPRFV